MHRITPFLMFKDQAQEALALYTSVFKDSKVVSTMKGPDGKVLSATFELEGQRLMIYNGGPSFSFSEGFSLFVSCETQAEVDELWAKLTAGGGKPGRCGWLTDRFGVSWQIIPTALPRLLGDRDPVRARRALEAMLAMSKLDIAALEAAANAA